MELVYLGPLYNSCDLTKYNFAYIENIKFEVVDEQ